MEQNPIADYYYNCIRHLQYIDLQFGARENPYHPAVFTPDQTVSQLVKLSEQVGLEINVDRLKDQEYLNHLHDLYFNTVNKTQWNTIWLEIHDCIHLLEVANGTVPLHKDIWFDYQHLAGPLIKPFNREYLEYAITDAEPGMCYLQEHELGKSPLMYQQTQEVADIEIMCQLVKPWVDLKPVLSIQTKTSKASQTFNLDEFNQWFDPFKEQWCKHWQLTGWQPWEMFAKIPVGHIEDVALLVKRFSELNYPKRITQ